MDRTHGHGRHGKKPGHGPRAARRPRL